MATLREFILAGSSLPTGNTVRDHIQNQQLGTGTVIIGGDLKANSAMSLSANIGQSLSVNVDSQTLSADVGTTLSANINQPVLKANLCQ